EPEEVSDFGRPDVGPAVDPATVARDLIAIRSLVEMEERVLEVIREATGARWVALYRPVDGAYRLRRALNVEMSALPGSLAGACALLQVDDRFLIAGAERTQEDDRFPGPFTCIRIRAEFEHLPALLIVGTAEGESEESPTADLVGIIDVCSLALRN